MRTTGAGRHRRPAPTGATAHPTPSRRLSGHRNAGSPHTGTVALTERNIHLAVRPRPPGRLPCGGSDRRQAPRREDPRHVPHLPHPRGRPPRADAAPLEGRVPGLLHHPPLQQRWYRGHQRHHRTPPPPRPRLPQPEQLPPPHAPRRRRPHALIPTKCPKSPLSGRKKRIKRGSRPVPWGPERGGTTPPVTWRQEMRELSCLMIRAGTPTAVLLSGTSHTTTALAPILTLLPIVTSPIILAPAPI